MARKPGTKVKGEFVFYNVTYEDGSQRSNRRVPTDIAEGDKSDDAVRAYLAQQDREIAEKSGMPSLGIKSVSRVKK